MQGADLVKNFAFQLLATVLQQRAVNVAADQYNSFYFALLLYHRWR